MSTDYSRLPANLPVPEDDGAAEHLYPVFPPDRDAGEVLAWLADRTSREG